MKEMRFAWAITGAGHTLTACADQLLRYKNIDVMFSQAAKEVVRMYSLQERFEISDLKSFMKRKPVLQ